MTGHLIWGSGFSQPRKTREINTRRERVRIFFTITMIGFSGLMLGLREDLDVKGMPSHDKKVVIGFGDEDGLVGGGRGGSGFIGEDEDSA